MINQSEALPIKARDIEENKKKFIRSHLSSVEWSPKSSERVEKASPEMREMMQQMTNTSQKLGLLRTLEELSGSPLIAPRVSYVADTIATGLALGNHIAGLYAKTSGLVTLRQKNDVGKLDPGPQVAEFEQKKQTEAAVYMFIAAYYTVFCKQQQRKRRHE
jgi:hypothetical protein